jgi:predicted RNase H-like nuclease
MNWIAGVDGCKAGWVAVFKNMETGAVHPPRVIRNFSELLVCPENPQVIMVDIPIGLLDEAVAGGRKCDRECRATLKERGCCVFSAPVRGCLDATSPEEAAEISRVSSPAKIAISWQAFGIVPKIREVDECMTPELQSRVFEAHPELSFAEMNGGTAISIPKREPAGKAERRKLLMEHGFSNIPDRPNGCLRREVAGDDILDAYAMLWTAERKFCGQAVRVPESPLKDAKGLRMEIWR